MRHPPAPALAGLWAIAALGAALCMPACQPEAHAGDTPPARDTPKPAPDRANSDSNQWVTRAAPTLMPHPVAINSDDPIAAITSAPDAAATRTALARRIALPIAEAQETDALHLIVLADLPLHRFTDDNPAPTGLDAALADIVQQTRTLSGGNARLTLVGVHPRPSIDGVRLSLPRTAETLDVLIAPTIEAGLGDTRQHGEVGRAIDNRVAAWARQTGTPMLFALGDGGWAVFAPQDHALARTADADPALLRNEDGNAAAPTPKQSHEAGDSDAWERETADVDRRVTVVLRGFNGDPNDPSGFGRSAGWRRPPHIAVPAMEQAIRRQIAAGVTRIMILLPFGSDGKMITDQFRHMDPVRKQLMGEMVANIKRDHPDVELGVYSGSGVDEDPSTPDFHKEWRPMRFADPADREYVHTVFMQVAELGFDFVWIDNVTGGGGGGTPLEWLKFVQAETGLDTYGEAFPTGRGPQYPQTKWGVRIGVDREKADAWRWMALDQYIRTRNITTDGHHDHYMGLTGHMERWRTGDNEQRKQIIDEVIEQGFVPMIYSDTPSRLPELARHAVQSLARYEARKGPPPDQTR